MSLNICTQRKYKELKAFLSIPQQLLRLLRAPSSAPVSSPSRFRRFRLPPCVRACLRDREHTRPPALPSFFVRTFCSLPRDVTPCSPLLFAIPPRSCPIRSGSALRLGRLLRSCMRAGADAARLVSWVRAMPRAYIGPIAVAKSSIDGGGLGLRVTRPVFDGEVLLAVPREATIAIDTTLESVRCGERFATLWADYGERSALAGFLVKQLFDHEAPYHPYCSALPWRRQRDHMLWWPSDRLACLAGTTTHSQIIAAREQVNLSLSAVVDAVLSQERAAHGAQVMEAAVRDAHALVLSRTFELQWGEVEEESLTMCPLLDFCQHGPDPSLRFSCEDNGRDESDGGPIVARAIGTLPTGHELCFSYGAHADYVFATRYGFVPPLLEQPDSCATSCAALHPDQSQSLAPCTRLACALGGQWLCVRRCSLARVATLAVLRLVDALGLGTLDASAIDHDARALTSHRGVQLVLGAQQAAAGLGDGSSLEDDFDEEDLMELVSSDVPELALRLAACEAAFPLSFTVSVEDLARGGACTEGLVLSARLCVLTPEEEPHAERLASELLRPGGVLSDANDALAARLISSAARMQLLALIFETTGSHCKAASDTADSDAVSAIASALRRSEAVVLRQLVDAPEALFRTAP